MNATDQEPAPDVSTLADLPFHVLGRHPKALLVGRLARRLRALGLTSFGDYLRRVEEDEGEEAVRLLDCITTNETQFFREPRQFDFLLNTRTAEQLELTIPTSTLNQVTKIIK